MQLITHFKIHEAQTDRIKGETEQSSIAVGRVRSAQ